VACEEASFGLPEPRVGRLPLDGGMVLLQRQIPHRQAMGLLLTGRRMKAQEALGMGLINEVVPKGTALERARAMAEQIRLKSPVATTLTKQLINAAEGDDVAATLEIIAGARDLDQIARWVSDDVYRHLAKRVQIAVRARTATGAPPVRPTFALGRTIITEPSDGVVEAVVVIHGRARTRSVALRLEGLDHRWRATAVHVL
jgi:hypothetical protein